MEHFWGSLSGDFGDDFWRACVVGKRKKLVILGDFGRTLSVEVTFREPGTWSAVCIIYRGVRIKHPPLRILSIKLVPLHHKADHLSAIKCSSP